MGNKSKEIFQAIRGLNVAYVIYPVVAAGVAAGAAVANGAGANTFTAADVAFVGVGTITTEYWFCGVDVGAIDVADTFLVDVRAPIDLTSIYGFRAGISAVTGNLGTFKPPLPVRVAPSVSLGARSAGVAGTHSITISVVIATGL
jgi:hypothetical protein